MRIVHMTDVHFLAPPRLRGVVGKRALGLANLYAFGRAKYFDASEVVASAVDDAARQKPDLFVMTGDMTAMAQDEEFRMAREAFAPLLESVPSAVVPGNHDRYTLGAAKGARMERWFADFMGGGTWDDEQGRWLGGGGSGAWPAEFRLGDTTIVGTDPCRPTVRSTGRMGSEVIAAAERVVAAARAEGRQVVYLVHYPPLWNDGRPYDRDGHNLVDNDDLLASLRRQPPHLLLHGHKHECWRTALEGEGGRTVVLNCGSTSAISPLPDRAAGYWIIDLEGGRVTALRRRVRLADSHRWSDLPDFAWADAG